MFNIMRQWCILVFGSADVMPRRENFLKHGLKQGLLKHSEQIVKCGGGHRIFSLCPVSKFRHQSVT